MIWKCTERVWRFVMIRLLTALVERSKIVEKIMAYKEEYGMPILQPQQEAKQALRLKKS